MADAEEEQEQEQEGKGVAGVKFIEPFFFFLKCRYFENYSRMMTRLTRKGFLTYLSTHDPLHPRLFFFIS